MKDSGFSASQNFSTPARSNIRGPPGVSIGEFLVGKEERFLRYCEDTGTHHPATKRGYLSVLKKMTDTYIPQDLVGRTLTRTEFRALPKFYGFIESDIMLNTGFNGYTRIQWMGNQKRTKDNIGSRANQRTKDLTPEEVAAVMQKLEPAYQVFYALVAFSGSRAEHLYKFLSRKYRKLEMINGVLRADISDTTAGKKKEAYLYFPPEMEKAILSYKLPNSLDYFHRIIAKVSPKDRPVNLSSLRKWNFNILMDHMDRVYANAIQGRAADGVDAAHYMDTAGKAAKHYPDALPDLRKGIPVPEWMEMGDIPAPTKKQNLPNKGATGLDRVGEKKRNEIIKMLEMGMNTKQIALTLHTSKLTVRNIRDGKKCNNGINVTICNIHPGKN